MRIVGGFALLALGLPGPENVDGGVDDGVDVVAADLTSEHGLAGPVVLLAVPQAGQVREMTRGSTAI